MKNVLFITIILLSSLALKAQTKPLPPELDKIEIPEDSSKSTKTDILSNALITEDSNKSIIMQTAGDHEPEFPLLI
jgi:hypothetical protein